MYDSRVNFEAWSYRTGRRDSTVSFGVSGILRDGALVMYDRATYSLWTQQGVAFAYEDDAERYAEGLRRAGMPEG